MKLKAYVQIEVQTVKDQSNSLEINLDIAVSAVRFVCTHPALYVYLYLSYWSHKKIGGPFYDFQWDTLLTMARFAVQVSLVLWLMKVLLFRLMLESRLMKGRGLTELLFGYTTTSQHNN